MISILLLVIIVILALGIIGDIGIIGALLAFVGIFLFIGFLGILLEKSNERAKKRNPEAWENRQRREALKEEARLREKYHDYQYTCPMCGSKEVRSLSVDERTNPINGSGKIGKNYHCDKCKYIW